MWSSECEEGVRMAREGEEEEEEGDAHDVDVLDGRVVQDGEGVGALTLIPSSIEGLPTRIEFGAEVVDKERRRRRRKKKKKKRRRRRRRRRKKKKKKKRRRSRRKWGDC